MADEELSEAVFIRVTKADKAALDALAARMPMKAGTIARLALRIGTMAIDKDPSIIFTASKPAKGRK